MWICRSPPFVLPCATVAALECCQTQPWLAWAPTPQTLVVQQEYVIVLSIGSKEFPLPYLTFLLYLSFSPKLQNTWMEFHPLIQSLPSQPVSYLYIPISEEKNNES
jgi:hypothetical protein